MRRFHINKINEKDGFCIFPPSEAHHIVKVLRMKEGDNLVIMDNDGQRFLAQITYASRHEVRANFLKQLPSPSSSPVEITLCQSILKSKHMDYMIQKTSELGVNHIIPFISERTTVKLKHEKKNARIKRWEEIALNAAKQSDMRMVPKIDIPVQFNSMITRFDKNNALKIILYEGESDCDMKRLLKGSSFNKIIGLVGPEGGFSIEEVESAKKADFVPVSMGKRILRAETAAVIIMAIVQYESGDLCLL